MLAIHKEPLFPKARKPVPFAFVLDALAGCSSETRAMFGCLGVYVGDKMVHALREKPDGKADNGVWLATTEAPHASLRREFLHMRSIQAFGKKVTGWQVLPVDLPDFEEAAVRACELIVAGEQCHRLHYAEGHARRASAGDPCGEGSEAGGDAKTAVDSPAPGCVKSEYA